MTFVASAASDNLIVIDVNKYPRRGYKILYNVNCLKATLNFEFLQLLIMMNRLQLFNVSNRLT